jgi:hypothetical protein
LRSELLRAIVLQSGPELLRTVVLCSSPQLLPVVLRCSELLRPQLLRTEVRSSPFQALLPQDVALRQTVVLCFLVLPARL